MVAILFPKKPNELKIYWAEKMQFTTIQEVEVSGDSLGYKGNWQSISGLKPGMSLTQVVKLNEKPFTISGFGWAFGGYVVGWEGGKLDYKGISCSFSEHFNNNITKPQYASIQGDTEFNVSLEAIKSMNPIVEKLMVYKK